jgi:hypothetical protein
VCGKEFLDWDQGDRIDSVAGNHYLSNYPIEYMGMMVQRRGPAPKTDSTDKSVATSAEASGSPAAIVGNCRVTGSHDH